LRIDVDDDGHAVSVSDHSSGIDDRFHALWLRDACACPDCRRPETNERLLDPTSLALDVRVRSAQVGADGLSLLLQFTDGHDVTLTADFLAGLAPSLRDRSADPMDGRTTWASGGGSGDRVRSFDRDHLGVDSGLRDMVNTLCDVGVVVIKGVAPTEHGLLDTAGLIGRVQPSNYGLTWSIEATISPESAVDSERNLQVHTDLPYRRTPAGVQLIMAVVVDVGGGASTVVDGFSMAECLRADHPDAWRLLTTVAFDYPYSRPGVELRWDAPLITLDHHGAYTCVRRAPDLVGSPIVAADDTPALYQALRLWADLLDEPPNQAQVRLEPGDMLVFDNHRMLHGRAGFELGASGRRHLIGCYLDIDELNNRRAVLNNNSG
jgi:gamma-butyrobetaine dioxygenase